MIGIYKITNIINGDCYIGSSVNIKERFYRHKKDLKKGKHHSIILQRAYKKYGKENFIFEVLTECDKELLEEKENEFLILFEPKYNICKIAYSNLGRVCTEETRLKHRYNALKNNVVPPKVTWQKKQKPVSMLDYNTKQEIKNFSSVSEACRYIGKDHTFASTISSVCNGKRNSAFNYKWKWR
jgi:hypothetical protein